MQIGPSKEHKTSTNQNQTRLACLAAWWCILVTLVVLLGFLVSISPSACFSLLIIIIIIYLVRSFSSLLYNSIPFIRSPVVHRIFSLFAVRLYPYFCFHVFI